uniref:Uncharacterized protein n=1 Tax=Meloidogyne enterolobii TaxID=390850 RepID=A0A6V7WCY5_MELEN|nr:unnamed protein product [Meloidogyne enterolobii]
MSLKAFLAIILVSCFSNLFSNCSSEEKNLYFLHHVDILYGVENFTYRIPLDNVTNCRGILLCYSSQLSSDSESTSKPTKVFEIVKKDEKPNNLIKMEEQWHGFVVFKEGNSSLEIRAEIFPKGVKHILRNITTLEFFEFLLNKDNDNSIKYKILKESKVDQDFLDATTRNSRPLLDEYLGVFALKWDIMFGKTQNIPFKFDYRMFFYRFLGKCPDKEMNNYTTPFDDNLYPCQKLALEISRPLP